LQPWQLPPWAIDGHLVAQCSKNHTKRTSEKTASLSGIWQIDERNPDRKHVFGSQPTLRANHWKPRIGRHGAKATIQSPIDLYRLRLNREVKVCLINSANGIDLTLRVVARYHGEEVARATARHMEYRHPDDNMRRVETTPKRNGRWWRRWLGMVKRGNRSL
jgi:hypothetical protein